MAEQLDLLSCKPALRRRKPIPFKFKSDDYR